MVKLILVRGQSAHKTPETSKSFNQKISLRPRNLQTDGDCAKLDA
jgi:hypothetical protein